MMPDDAILEIKQVSGLALSADKTWHGDSSVYLELYRALVTSGMLASISGNAFKVLIAMGLRARVLGGDAEGESLFRHLMSLKLVSQADRGKLFCYATHEDLIADCGFGSNNTLIQAVQCLSDRQLIEKRSRHRQRRRDASSYVANVYLIRPASSIRKFNAGYNPLAEQRPQGDQASHMRMQKMHSQAHTVGVQKVHSRGAAGVQKLHSRTRGSAESALNKKEEDEEGEEDQISFILGRFAARKGDPAYTPDAQECRKVRTLFHEGYSAQQIAAAIEQAFDTRPTKAKPVRGFGFVVSHLHRHLRPTSSLDRPLPPSTEDSTGVFTEGTSPTGEPTGMTTETKAAVDADITPLQGTSGDPLTRVYTLLRAASIRGMEGVENVHYDLPGIRLGLRRFAEGTDPFSVEEIHSSVLAAVSRGIQPERLVGYTKTVLENARAEARERERLRLTIAETVHTGHDGNEALPETSLHRFAARMGASDEQEGRYPLPGKEALALWQSALSELELQMTRATFNTWLKPTTLLAWETEPGATRVILGVPNGYVKDWLENRLCTPIRRTLSGIAGREVEVEFRITDQTDLQSRPQQVKR